MSDVVKPNSPDLGERGRALRKMLNLSKVEQDTKFRYLKMDVQVIKLTNSESWEELASLARQGRGNALTTLARLKGMSKMAPQMPFERIDFRKLFSDPEFRAGLEELMTESGKDISSIDRYLDKANYNKIAAYPKMMIDNTLSEQGAYAVATGFTGYWAGFFAEFNLACQKRKLVSLKESDVETISDFLSGQSETLESFLFQLKEMLAELTPDDIYKKSMNILLELEECLVWLPAFAAKVYLALERAVQKQDTNLIGLLAEMDLTMGAFIRRWALVTATALYAAHMGTLHEEDKTFKDIKKNSQKLPMESLIPYGEEVTVQELAENGWRHNSKLIRVSGFVSDIKISRAGNIYRTEFTLSDSTAPYHVQALSVYTNLPHRGMIGGSYVNLNGTWEMTSKIADHPIVKIDRVTLSKYKKESWLDYMTTIIRPWFDLYPNSHNLVWSVRPEKKGGEAAKESTETGAGELRINRFYLHKGGK